MPRTVEAYLQYWRRQGFTDPAAVAHLAREVHEGYIEPPFPSGTYIIAMDGRFFVEAAYGPPAPATNYICRERTRAERIDFLSARDRPPWSDRSEAQASDPPPAPEPEPEPEPVVAEPKPRKPGGGRHRALTQEQIDKGIALLKGQTRMSVDAARWTLREAGIDAGDTVLYDLIIKHAYANESS